ncbi:MAG: Activator of Hsp90 ATPase 1 family protein [Flaviaesturariibacter sp.]|nr:Activator of Hsp90 ATPase 1 family protein [Flaviaesturariibacter sp.]
MDTAPFIIERRFAAPIETVWDALTNRDRMKEWYFDLAEFRAEPGFEFSFEGGGTDGETFTHLCRVTVADEPSRLAYTWRYEGFPGESIVTFELFPDGAGTRLRLTHANLHTFRGDINPALASSNFAAGWTSILDSSLAPYLERTTTQASA